jgi:lysophospholipase L1-like esterase
MSGSIPTTGIRAWVADLCLFAAALGAALVVLDLPKLDTHPDPVLNTLRYPGVDNVYRGEDYSRYHVNRYGLVGDEPAATDDPGIFRVAVFGDSFVEALQVPERHKFTRLLQSSLLPPAGRSRVEVWNFGHSADNTGNEYARFVSQRTGASFDLVLFTFNEADLLEDRPQDVPDRSGSFLVGNGKGGFDLVHDASRAASERLPWFNRTFPRFHNLHLTLRDRVGDYLHHAPDRLRGLVAGWIGRGAPTGAGVAAGISAEQIESGYEQLVYVYRSIRARGIPVILVGLPTDAAAPAGLSSHRANANLAYRDLAARLKQAGIAFVDTYPLIDADVAQGRDPYSDWEPFHHFNRDGHRLLARAIATFLAGHGEYRLAIGDPAIVGAGR